MLSAQHYDDGSIMSRDHWRRAALTLLAAGHETTVAATLGWAFERLSRHPKLRLWSRRSTTAVTSWGRAAILEVQRPDVIDLRSSRQSTRLPPGEIPAGDHYQYSRYMAIPTYLPQPIVLLTRSATGSKPSPFAWDPCGGTRRRRGRIRQHEMDGVANGAAPLLTLERPPRPGERSHGRGVAFTPKDGGRVKRADADGRFGPAFRSRVRERLAPVQIRRSVGVASSRAGRRAKLLVALQVVLVLGFGFPEIPGRSELGRHLLGHRPDASTSA